MSDEREIWKRKADELGLPFVDLAKVHIDRAALELVPEELARRAHVMPVRHDRSNRVLWVAMATIDNVEVADELRMASGKSIRPVFAAPSDLENAIRRAYP